jgi:2',3'-cyclic-nucleotide 2'-phosphodiesterase (5'-nucleotidase family)
VTTSLSPSACARKPTRRVDLLLIDTGDRIEGNGLYDASEPKGEYTLEIFKEQEIDDLLRKS